MKSFIFILLCGVTQWATAAESSRFSVNAQTLLITYYGEAVKPKDQTFEGVEKAAWADAVDYLYKHYRELGETLELSEAPQQKVIPELLKRLRSKNTTYHRDGVVRVSVEFSFEGFEKNTKNPFAAYKQPPDKF